ncbi:MAG: hypothetical protein WCZ87_11055 [Thiohalobacteraceae bacterium]
MSLHIRAAASPAPARLRQLVLESLPQLLGHDAQALPSAGQMPIDTLVAIDAQQRLWVLSFSSEDPGRALLDGMAALQQIRDLLPWLRQVHAVGNDVLECSLLVLTTEVPAGAAELSLRAGLDWRRLRFIEVNGELGLWVEPSAPPAPKRQSQAPSQAQSEPRAEDRSETPSPPRPATLRPTDREGAPLSPEEEAFFQHL